MICAIGSNKNGKLADETTPFNWSSDFYYMTSKYHGQKIVEKAVREKGLQAIILNPASIMGPGLLNLNTIHNKLFNTIYKKTIIGSFPGGLAVVDVRDLVAIIIKAFEMGKIGEKYLVVGDNLLYRDVIRMIGKYAKRRVYPFPLPSFLFIIAGFALETTSYITKKRPLFTYAHGRLSGLYTYYSNVKSRRAFSHSYVNIEKTIQDTCTYFERTFL